MKLDKEEKSILDAYDKGLMKLSNPSKKEKDAIKFIVANPFRKDRRVTIPLYDHDLKGIQKKAMEKGIPDYTLISATMHRRPKCEVIFAWALSTGRGPPRPIRPPAST